MKEIFKQIVPEKLKYIESYIKSQNAADGSKVDANANVNNKNVATLNGELYKDLNIQLKRSIIYDEIKTLFDEDLAREYIRQIEEHEIYCHDESALNLPYCASITLYPLLLEGVRGLGGESKKPEHLESFCGSFVNLIFALSSQFAGAIGVPEFLSYFDKFARKDYGENYLTSHKKVIENNLQHVIYAINQPAAARNFQSVFLNISIFDETYFKSLFKDFVFPDGEKMNWESVKKLQVFFMKWMNKEREKAILTFPVVTASFINDGKEAIDLDFKKFLAEEISEGNSFFIYLSDSVDSLSSCCRLKNELNDNTFSYSLGAGGISTGSINVITINFNKLIQKGINLEDQIEKIHKYQIAFKSWIKKLIGKKMLPAYEAGYINIEKQFLTIGINGLVEAAEFLGFEISNNEKYKKWIKQNLKIIYDKNKEGKKKYKTMFNTEFVPAENLGVKFAKWNKKEGIKSNRDCYNSYFYKVEDSQIQIPDKFELHGAEINRYLDGGSALHLNLESYPTAKSAEKIIDIAIKSGCNYFCTNVKITICKDCGYINKNTENYCVKCNSKNITHATRIIGYLKEIDAWTSERQIEEKMRFYN